MERSQQILRGLQYEKGLLSASVKSVGIGYNRAWIRDNIYTGLGFEATGDTTSYLRAYRAILYILLKHDYKIDCSIKERSEHHFQYIHPRYDPITMEEIGGEWGNKQNDAIGGLLFKIGD